MQVVVSGDRYFVGETARDLHDIALKLLNELRIFENPGPRRDLYEQVCDDMDGDTAYAIIRSLAGIEVHPVETL